MEVNTGPSIQTQVEVQRQAENVQEQSVSRVLRDDAQHLQQQQDRVEETQEVSTSEVTGLGGSLDITA